MKSGHIAVVSLLIGGVVVWIVLRGSVVAPTVAPLQASVVSDSSPPGVDDPAALDPGSRIDASSADVVVAATPAAPLLTLTGHLEAQIVGSQPPDRLASPASSANWLMEARFNPQGKVLSADMMAQLDAIAASFNERMLALLVRDKQLANEACLLALRQGQIHSLVAGIAGVGENPAVVSRDNAKAVAETQADLARRLGKETVDWSCRQIASRDPDGVFRTHIIYYMRHQARDHFAGKEAIAQLHLDVRRQVRELIARAP